MGFKMEIIAAGIIIALVGVLLGVLKSHSTLNREIGELKTDVENIKEEMKRLRENLDMYVGNWKAPEK
ncbi:hypothetical protein ES702_06795 [subsurface metagenome]